MNRNKVPHASRFIFTTVLLLSIFNIAQAKPQRPPSGGRLAVVVDERLSALRETPSLSGKLLQRVSRGRMVAVQRPQVSRDGIVFYRVRLTTRTRGWIQKEALVSPNIVGDDLRLLRLIELSEDFDRLARAKIFLANFSRSRLRPEVLLIYATAAEAAAQKLSRDAVRRLDPKQIAAGPAAEFSYFLNYSGLDRYNRQGVTFIFDRRAREFHYDGKAWREIVARYPLSAEAQEARRLLALLESRN
jgi:hypothetical protein